MYSHSKDEHFKLIKENKIYTAGQYRWFYKNKLTGIGYYQIPWLSFGYNSYGNFFIDAWDGNYSRKELNKLAAESEMPRYCIYHKDNEAIKGKSFCIVCEQATKKVIENKKCKSHRSEDCLPGRRVCHICLLNNQNRYKKNKEIGKCVVNGHGNRDVVPGKTMCVECLTKLKETNRNRVKMGKLLGKCIRHPRRDVVTGKTRCFECIEKIRQAKKKMV